MKSFKEIKKATKEKLENAKAFYGLHRSWVNGAIAAFVGALGTTLLISKKLNKSSGEEADEDSDWRGISDFEEGQVNYKGNCVTGAWFTTEKGGRIFFAENEDGTLP